MEMASDDDVEHFSPSEEASSPVPKRTLKRLKKVKTIAEESSKIDQREFKESSGGNLEESDLGSFPGSDWVGDENETKTVLKDLEAARKVLDFDSVSLDLEEKCENRAEDMEAGDEIGGLRTEESAKKRRVPDGTESNKDKKKRKKKNKCIGFDELPVSSASSNLTKKERREHLDQLRAESQRLLRETRDAAFRPVPLVQNSISSVLEKIRRRKLEVSKNTRREPFLDERSDSVLREVRLAVDYNSVSADGRGNDMPVKNESVKLRLQQSIRASPAEVSGELENHQSFEAENNSNHETCTSNEEIKFEAKQALRAPIDDTQDLFPDSQKSDSRDETLNETPNSPLEEVLAPSLLTMNLKLDSALAHDGSDDDEDNDKENIDMHPPSSSPDGDPVKAFVDEEAEEEDDSDNDLLHFKEDEEDEDDEDDLQDMIVTQYTEKQIDTERREELHRKWLEQQDNVGTENLLQRLKCGGQLKNTSLLEEEEHEEDEDDKEASDDELADYSPPSNSMRMTIKKIKEMIPQMFTDEDDVYISSDDEEMEKQLDRQCFFEKTKQKVRLLSPSKDESSKELFCRIKKVNTVPDSRKKAKISSFSHESSGRNRSFTPKSSFLGRAPKHSMPPSQKRGSSMMRSFIFERDDSNSRNSVSTADETSETIQQQNRATRSPPAKFSNSQTRPSSQTRTAEAETSLRTPLYELLKRSSLQSAYCTRDSMITDTESVYAAFKLEKKPTKSGSVKTL